jgi:hypothetical protein
MQFYGISFMHPYKQYEAHPAFDQAAYMDFFFTVVPCSFILSSPLFIQVNAQLNCSKRMLKLTLKFTLKSLLHVSV